MLRPPLRNTEAQQNRRLFWQFIHDAVHDEARWLDSVHDFARWLELDRPRCIRDDDTALSPLLDLGKVDAAQLQFLLLLNADPSLELAGLSSTETITYVLHSTFGFSQSEIAIFRRVSTGTVKSTLHRVHKKLAIEEAA